MPAPSREAPFTNFRTAINPLRGIVGHYSDAETDAMLAEYASKDSVEAVLQAIPAPEIIKHPVALPLLAPGLTPLGFLRAWEDYETGVHSFLNGDTAIVHKWTGPESVNGRDVVSQGASITVLRPGGGAMYCRVKSTNSDGAEFPADSEIFGYEGGTWYRLTSAQGDVALAQVSVADLFASADLSNLTTKPELAAAIAGKLDEAGSAEKVSIDLAKSAPAVLTNWMRQILTSPDFLYWQSSTVPAMDHGHVMQDIPGLYSSLEAFGIRLQDLEAALPGQSAIDLSAYYTKPQTDAAIKAAADESALNLDAVQSQLVWVIEETGRQTQAKIDLKADKAALSDYAKLTDDAQVVTAQRFEGRAVIFQQFLGEPSRGNLGLADLNNGNGSRLGISFDGKAPRQLAWVDELPSIDTSDLVTKPELAAAIAAVPSGGTVDVSAFAPLADLQALSAAYGTLSVEVEGLKNFQPSIEEAIDSLDTGKAAITDSNQVVTAKSFVAQGYGFGQDKALVVHDTGEGYGERLCYVTVQGGDQTFELVTFKSDIEQPLNQLEQALAALQPGPWEPIPLKTEYATVSGKFARIRTLPGNNVQIIGEINRADGGEFTADAYITIATLPDKYRPALGCSWTVPTYGGTVTGSHANIVLNANGSLGVNAKQTSPHKVELSGIYYQGPYPS